MAKPVAFEIRITVDPSGSMDVTGPLDNPMLCYGMLEVARDLIHKEVDKRARAGGIIVAPAMAMPDPH